MKSFLISMRDSKINRTLMSLVAAGNYFILSSIVSYRIYYELMIKQYGDTFLAMKQAEDSIESLFFYLQTAPPATLVLTLLTIWVFIKSKGLLRGILMSVHFLFFAAIASLFVGNMIRLS